MLNSKLVGKKSRGRRRPASYTAPEKLPTKISNAAPVPPSLPSRTFQNAAPAEAQTRAPAYPTQRTQADGAPRGRDGQAGGGGGPSGGGAGRRRRRWRASSRGAGAGALADAGGACGSTVPGEDVRAGGGPGDGRRGVVGRGAEQLRGVGPARLRRGAPPAPLQARQLLHLPPAAQHLRIPQGEPGQVGVCARRLPRQPVPPPPQHPPPARRGGRIHGVRDVIGREDRRERERRPREGAREAAARPGGAGAGVGAAAARAAGGPCAAAGHGAPRAGHGAAAGAVHGLPSVRHRDPGLPGAPRQRGARRGRQEAAAARRRGGRPRLRGAGAGGELRGRGGYRLGRGSGEPRLRQHLHRHGHDMVRAARGGAGGNRRRGGGARCGRGRLGGG
ncbi:hypothetical protein PVAP13_4NG211743 [Panicum virgatum]|uniref:Uncharacterized protein n=1 Tax=Panicum virgatum TaxID=38727 RepID=A0A8T0TBR4_PANVG|nr:hypothetical protein PVAP13_4NG211743 [Panicum virgatum]